MSASYLDLHLVIDSERRLGTRLYDAKYNYNFPIVNFPFISNSIRAPSVYGVYISQLIRYSRACDSYKDVLDRELLLTRKLLINGFLLDRWMHHIDILTLAIMALLIATEYLCLKWPRICSTCRTHFPSFPRSWLITGFVSIIRRRVALVEQELLTLLEHLTSHTVFCEVHIFPSLVLCAMFLLIVVCTFLPFLFTIVLTVLWFTDSDYTFGIFKLFLYDMYWHIRILFLYKCHS